MSRSLQEVLDSLPPSRRAAIDQRMREMVKMREIAKAIKGLKRTGDEG